MSEGDINYPTSTHKRRRKRVGKTPAQKRREERRKAQIEEVEDEEGKFLCRKPTYFNEVAATGSDFRTVLKDNERLSDGIVDMFGAVLQKKYERNLYITIYVMNKIKFDPEKTAGKVATNPKCKDFFNMEKILFPVHVGQRGQAHWLCLVLEVKEGILKEYNSLSHVKRKEIESVKMKINKFLVSLHEKMYKHKMEGQYDPITFKEKAVPCTQQPSGSLNCGIWLCTYLLAVCQTSVDRKEDIQIREDQMADIRKDISQIIHRGYI